MKTTLKNILLPQAKSNIKAGDGHTLGQYKFFTSSQIQSKYINSAEYFKPGLIFGTGGSPSIHFCNTPFSTSTDCLVMYAKDNTNLEFVYQYLKSRMYLLERGFRGAGLKHISKSYILDIQIEVPESKTQEKAVETFNILENIIIKKNQQIVLLNDIIKSRFIEMFGDPQNNSQSLNSMPMTDVCYIIDGDRGKNYPTANDFYEDEHCLFLNAKNVTSNGFSFDSCMFITKEKDQSLRKGKLKRGDVVLTTRGTLGNLAYYTDDVPYENIRINSGMVILRMHKSTVNEVFFIEQFKMLLDDIKAKIASGSAQPQLPISTMNKIVMIIPEISEQNQFADFVAQVDKSKLAVQQSLNELETLKKSLMQQYFG